MRPLMDPMFLREQEEQSRYPWLTHAMHATGRALRWVGRKMLTRPFRFRRKPTLDDETTVLKVFRGVCYRLLFLPVILAGASAGLVYLGTHPATMTPLEDPATSGVYFDPINFPSLDGTQLQAWFVPVVDARRVLLHRERLLAKKYPAVVLAHDFGKSPAQMIPLMTPLHEEGFVVVAVGLRGVGAGLKKGQTFGINESLDVSATVDMLRRRPFVDEKRIAVVGVGSGANAALLAAARDPSIKALALADPISTPERALEQHVGPDRAGLRWMQVPNRLAFQIAYRLDLDDMNLNRADAVSVSRPILKLKDRTDTDGRLQPTAVNEIRDFCRKHLQPAAGQATAAAGD